MAKTGAVTLIQRFGSALNLNVHFHTCCFSTVCMSSNPTAQRVSAGSRRRPAQSSPS
uniref:transposase n=1 Tax=Escherichia sp. TaxID=1884818 RepID=UPI003B636E27